MDMNKHKIKRQGWEDDTYWIELNPGFICSETETHAISESTKQEALAKMSSVVKCNCSECQELKSK